MFYTSIIIFIAWMLLYHIFLEYANLTVNMVVIGIFTIFEYVLCYIYEENFLFKKLIVNIYIQKINTPHNKSS